MAVPNEPIPFRVRQSSRTSIFLEWGVPHVTDESAPPVTRYRIQSSEFPDIFVDVSVQKYEIKNLIQTRLYKVLISAENEHGFGPAAAFPEVQPGCDVYGWV